MLMFVGIIVVVWLSAMTVWWMLSSFLRTSDFTKIKERLSGGQKKKAKAGTLQQKQLLQSDLQTVPGMFSGVIRRYNVLPRVNELIDQAGLRWNPLRTVHLCAALFIGGAGFCWFI